MLVVPVGSWVWLPHFEGWLTLIILLILLIVPLGVDLGVLFASTGAGALPGRALACHM